MNPDWIACRAQYELGAKSIRTLAKEFDVTDSAIAHNATRHGWVRDPLALAKIKEARDAKITADARKNLAVKRAEVIAITATMQSRVLVAHRTDIQQARHLATSLLTELTKLTTDVEIFENVGEFLAAPDERGRDRLNKIYRRVISLPERSATLSSLANSLKTLILLERQAYGIAGLIEDPEAVRPPAEVTRGLDTIMAKFDAVLALQVGDPKASVSLPEVFDVSPKTEAATT